MQATLSRKRAVPVDRSTDRRVALWSVATAMAFLLAALFSLLLPEATRRGLWLPVHLALAGAATAAIAGVMPFFVAAFAAAQPADARVRIASLIAVTFGAVAVTLGVVSGSAWLGITGGVAFVVGLALVGVAVLQPLRGALGPSRGLVARGYLGALVLVAIGATTATLDLAGWPPVAEAWVRLKPAHAWINLVGFVSLVIATTLMHFFPTTIGSRIGSGASGRVTILGLGAGGLTVPIGYATQRDLIAQVGAVFTLIGALALVVYAAGRWRSRATWTTDPGWHRFVIGGLVSAIAWFVVGIGIAAGRILAWGADPAGWAIDLVAAPLVAGWVGLAVVASASHLLPAVGPGDPASHARQRVLLGRFATPRLALLNLGIGLLSVAAWVDAPVVAAAGTVLTLLGFTTTAGLIAAAIWIGVRAGRARPAPAS
jgi:nitrite reductase (NO-forming)